MDYRFHIAIVTVSYTPYLGKSKELTKYHTVEADTEEEAEEKIRGHYSAKGEAHGDSYIVTEIDFFEPI